MGGGILFLLKKENCCYVKKNRLGDDPDLCHKRSWHRGNDWLRFPNDKERLETPTSEFLSNVPPGRSATYRKHSLGWLPKRAITERKLEDQAYRYTGLGVPITGFDALQVFADMLEKSQVLELIRNLH